MFGDLTAPLPASDRLKQIKEEHAELERLYLKETGASIYEPYFPYQ